MVSSLYWRTACRPCRLCIPSVHDWYVVNIISIHPSSVDLCLPHTNRSLHYQASISLALTAFNIDYVAGIMLIPTLLAVSVSGWMNVVIFWNRLEDRRRQATIDAFHMRRQAAMRALKWE